jgi:hypothetical protein
VPTTFPPCATKETFQKTLSVMVMRLMATSCTLEDVAGKPLLKLKRECKMLEADILMLKRKIAVHQSQHGCCP